MKNKLTKQEKRNKRKAKKNILFQSNQKDNYNIKFGDIYQRINYLLNLSCDLYKDNPILSQTYVTIMKDIIKKNALRVDSRFKKLICTNCNNLIFLDTNVKIELKSKFFSNNFKIYLGK